MLLVAEKFTTSESHDLLRLGAKGLLTYGEAREQLPRALPMMASGGFWVPRSLLSEFVDTIITNSHGRRMKVESAAQLSRREQEVLDSLLENLANKEIAERISVSESSIKATLQQLFAKTGVRTRSQLVRVAFEQFKNEIR